MLSPAAEWDFILLGMDVGESTVSLNPGFEGIRCIKWLSGARANLDEHWSPVGHERVRGEGAVIRVESDGWFDLFDPASW